MCWSLPEPQSAWWKSNPPPSDRDECAYKCLALHVFVHGIVFCLMTRTPKHRIKNIQSGTKNPTDVENSCITIRKQTIPLPSYFLHAPTAERPCALSPLILA